MNSTSIDSTLIETIKKKDLSPGDYLIFKLTRYVKPYEYNTILDNLKKIADTLNIKCKVILLDKDMSLSIENEQTTFIQETM